MAQRSRRTTLSHSQRVVNCPPPTSFGHTKGDSEAAVAKAQPVIRFFGI
jgi:hypothetical protein